MKYKLIGIRPNHKKMKEMVGTYLYRLESDGAISKCYITGIRISESDKWEFIITGEETFKDNEPLFATIKSVKRYITTQKKALG